jgi:hypothetical protein
LYNLFLDSGAFSAHTQGIKIDIDNYINFIKENQCCISFYANLDVVNDPKTTLKHQKIMESAGLNPVPVFHVGNTIEYLYHYIENYNYICIGGMVGKLPNYLIEYLDSYFSIISDKKGYPQIKIHGFGLTSVNLLLRYPWYSVDSSSWATISRMGAVLIPKLKNNKWDFRDVPWQVGFTARSPLNQDKLKHYKNLSPVLKRNVKLYIEKKGYSIGKSKFVNVNTDYKIKRGEELWYKKGEIVERVIEHGISNNHRMRNELNVLYFQDVADNMLEWPWPFRKYKKKKRFF